MAAVGTVVVVFGITMLFLAARASGGPDPVTPERSAIAGAWTNSDGARLVFRTDGTYTATGMPVIDESSTPGFDYLPADGMGTWVIEPVGANRGGGLSLIGPKSGIELVTTGSPAHPSLFAEIGDPDEGDDFTFTKQPG